MIFDLVIRLMEENGNHGEDFVALKIGVIRDRMRIRVFLRLFG